MPNHPGTRYYSLGGEKTPEYCAPIYKKSNSILRTTILRNLPYENDGVFGHDEIAWGKHLMNFELDHSQLIGIGGGQLSATYELIVENLRYLEAEEEVRKTATQKS